MSIPNGRKLVIAILIVVVLLWTLIHGTQRSPERTNDEQASIPGTVEQISRTLDFKTALRKYASQDGAAIFLSPGDYGYREMALNLYKTSYERFGLTNHLFVALDDQLCDYLTIHGAHCVQYMETAIANATTASSHGSDEFKRKVYAKSDIVTEALQLHISVILVDSDIVFLKNPLPFMKCSDCDLVIGPNGKLLCAGFYLINPTYNSQQLLLRMTAIFNDSNLTVLEQPTFNLVLSEMKKQGQIKYVVLDEMVFQRGRIFFKMSGRIFKGDRPCSDCVMVHNNFIVGLASKIYRFKEYGMWEVDTDGYYSNPDRKYITYGNPIIGENDTITRLLEDRALRTAFTLGHILNRTVILPKLNANGDVRSLLAFYKIETLDSCFKNCYRESVFLESDLVPNQVKSSLSQELLIQSKVQFDMRIIPPGVHVLASAGSAVAINEMTTWFTGNQISQMSVLKFHSLYIDLDLDLRTQSFVDELDHCLQFY